MAFWRRVAVGAKLVIKGAQALNGLRIGKYKIAVWEIDDMAVAIDRVVRVIEEARRAPTPPVTPQEPQ